MSGCLNRSQVGNVDKYFCYRFGLSIALVWQKIFKKKIEKTLKYPDF